MKETGVPAPKTGKRRVKMKAVASTIMNEKRQVVSASLDPNTKVEHTMAHLKLWHEAIPLLADMPPDQDKSWQRTRGYVVYVDNAHMYRERYPCPLLACGSVVLHAP